jgi:hypothetical protein
LLIAIGFLSASSAAAQDDVPGATIDIEADGASLAPYCYAEGWFTFDAEYWLTWARGTRLPPLVTTSPVGTGISDAGLLGAPGTEVLYGDNLTASGPRSGLRLRASAAIDAEHRWRFVADWLALPTYAECFAASSAGDGILTRPFEDVALGGPNAELVSFPGLVAGSVTVDASNDVWGGGFALQRNLLCSPWDTTGRGHRLDLLVGYRFLELSDRVWIDERLVSTNVGGPIVLGTQLAVTDAYESRSRFNGVDLGIRGEWARNRYFINGELRVALGQSDHRLDVMGLTRVMVPGVGGAAFPGGLLAGGDVIGEYTDRELAVVPQAELRIGRQMTDHLRLSVGYSFLYWSQVVRAGEHIGTTIDSSQLPSAGSTFGPGQPMPLSSSSFWVHGITANLEWRY